MTRTLHFAWVLGLLVAGLSGNLGASSSAVVNADHVVEALRESGLTAEAHEIEFPVSVPVATPDAPLRVQYWRKLDDNSIWIRLVCRQPKDCLPFFIMLHPGNPQAWPDLSHRLSSSRQVSPEAKSRAPVLVRAGRRAILLLENRGTRISTPVTCLENGSLGGKVRVRNTATKRIYLAQVVDRGVVRAWFE